MFKKTLFIILIFLSSFPVIYSQEEDSIMGIFPLKGIEVKDPSYERQYKYTLEKVRKIYPYALYAKSLLDRYNEDIKELTKERQLKKYGKTALEKLKEDFEYTLKNMYTSEGNLLMKLINRETGITVYDIIDKYRGKGAAGFYNVIGKLFDQDLKVTYDKKKDWLIERVLQDIFAGKYSLYEMDLLTKEKFKALREEERVQKKKYKQESREQKKIIKQATSKQKKQDQ
ncbi:MAG: DUF4294 domain-containing protein [Crocinitomicaceae bacterium]